ncbi:MAG: hypothetical protein LBQ75_10050 [Zoogloeaceae bacterium]|nr:hypothetical protein [Zoogloeaceae bacterium]
MSACATQKPGEAFIKKDDRIIGLEAGSCKKVKKDGASPQDAELACKGGGHHGFKSKEKKGADEGTHYAEIYSRIQKACGKAGGKYEGTFCILPTKDGLSVQRITVSQEGPGKPLSNYIALSLLEQRPAKWTLETLPPVLNAVVALPIAIVTIPVFIVSIPVLFVTAPIIDYTNHTVYITTSDDTASYLAEQQRQREAQARREAEEAERQAEQARWEADRPRREAEERRRQEAEALARREEEARLARFRKGLKTGDDTFCGPVIETRDNNKMIRISVRVKLQGYATSDEWLKAEEVYPPSYNCWNRNGRLSPY